MPQTLTLLPLEHRTMENLPEFFVEQIDEAKNSSFPDYELVSEIVNNFREYPGFYHHLEEDMIYREILVKDHTQEKC